MRINTDKNGLAAIFKEWQVPLVEELFKRRTLSSREAYEFLEELDLRTGRKKFGKALGSVSRASIINFLNYMVDQNILDFDLKTGKGGHHRIYKMTMTYEEFIHKIMDTFIETLEALPESATYLWPSA